MSGETRKGKAVRRARQLGIRTEGLTAKQIEPLVADAEREMEELLKLPPHQRAVNVEMHLTLTVPNGITTVEELIAYLREEDPLFARVAPAGGRLMEQWYS